MAALPDWALRLAAEKGNQPGGNHRSAQIFPSTQCTELAATQHFARGHSDAAEGVAVPAFACMWHHTAVCVATSILSLHD